MLFLRPNAAGRRRFASFALSVAALLTFKQALAATCATTQVVLQAGGGNCTSIQQCVNNIPSSLPGNWCIDIQDTAAYVEQVTIQGKTTNGFQIMIGGLSRTLPPTIRPPALSTAGVQILNTQVTLQNIVIAPTNPVTYGVFTSSDGIALSSVTVSDATGKIDTAGIFLMGNLSQVAYSSVTTSAAEGVQLGYRGPLNGFTDTNSDFLSYSYVSSSGSNTAAAVVVGADSSTVINSQIGFAGSAPAPAILVPNDNHNELIALNTIAAAWTGIYLSVGSYLNKITQNSVTANAAPGSFSFALYVASIPGHASSSNFIALSTLTVTGAPGSNAVQLQGDISDIVANCYIQSTGNGVYLTQSTGSVLSGNTIVGMNGHAAVDAAFNSGTNGAMAFISNTLTGLGSGAAAITLEQTAASGLVTISSNVMNSDIGVSIATQAAGAQVWITSNTIIPNITNARSTYGLLINGLTTGATIQNNGFYYRSAAASPTGANGTFFLYAKSAAGLMIRRNRFNNPGMVTGGNHAAVVFSGTYNSAFQFNDVNSTGTNFSNYAYLLDFASGSTGAVVKDNVFLSSFAFAAAGSSATLIVDGTSQTGFVSNYNDWFSSSGFTAFTWGSAGYQGLAAWQAGAGQDAASISSNPLWFNPALGVEDFHPRSQSGRYSPINQGFVADCFSSPGIDLADPAEAFNFEPAPNGGRANAGSYGDTPEASETFQAAPPTSAAATALVGQVTLSWTAPNFGACPSYLDHYLLNYSSTAAGGPFASLGSISSNTFAFVQSGLSASTTYYYQVFTVDGVGNVSSPAVAFAVTPDTVPPAAVSNLAAVAGTSVGQLSLSWTFPGDDNGSKPLPAGSQYAVEYATDNVGVVWSTANAQLTLSTGPVGVGAPQSTLLTGLTQSATYYVRIWTAHPGPIWSAASNAASSYSKQSSPSLLAVAPGWGSYCVPWSTAATLTFTKPVQYASLAAALNLSLIQDALGQSTSSLVAGSLSPASNSSTYTFTPASALASNGVYALTLSTAVVDLQGNPLSSAASAQFTTMVDNAATSLVGVANLGVSVLFPASALSAAGCLVGSTNTVSSNVGTANQKLSVNNGDATRYPLPGTVVDLKAYDALGNVQSAAFGAPVTVSIPYPDANNDGIVDGSNPPVRVGTLGVWWLDDANALWVRLPSSNVDTARKIVSAQTGHFTTFALIGQSATDLSGAYAFPVPFRPRLGHTQITFTGLGQNTRIRVFTITGELVADLNAASVNGQFIWNVKNSAGQNVTSGVYSYLLESGSNSQTGKLVIIR